MCFQASACKLVSPSRAAVAGGRVHAGGEWRLAQSQAVPLLWPVMWLDWYKLLSCGKCRSSLPSVLDTRQCLVDTLHDLRYGHKDNTLFYHIMIWMKWWAWEYTINKISLIHNKSISNKSTESSNQWNLEHQAKHDIAFKSRCRSKLPAHVNFTQPVECYSSCTV